MIASNATTTSAGLLAKRDRALFAVLLAALLLGVFDRRELGPQEVPAAAHIVAPFDGEERLPPMAPLECRLAEGLSAIVAPTGTTERALRLPLLLALAASAMLLSLHAQQSRAGLWVILGALALLLSSVDGRLLRVELLGLLPAALAATSLACAWCPGPLTFLSGLCGHAVLWLMPGSSALISVGLLLATASIARRHGGLGRMVRVGGPLAATALALAFWIGPEALTARMAPEAYGLAPARGVEVVLLALVVFVATGAWAATPADRATAPHVLRSVARVLQPLLIGAFIWAEFHGGDRTVGWAWATALLALSLRFVDVPRGRANLVVGLIGVAALLGGAFLLHRGSPATPESAPEYRTTLDTMRPLVPSGGRIVLAGPDRFGLLHYTRRGHDPRVPLILVPEDSSIDGLREALTRAFGRQLGPEEWPPVLLHPAGDAPPPGFAFSGPPRGASRFIRPR